MKKFLYFLLTISFTFIFSLSSLCSALVITLDPGHGAESFGANYEYDGKLICEKDLNLKIAKFLKEILEKNYIDQDGKTVEVFLTREDDSKNPSLDERISIAKEHSSDILISLHNNATARYYNHGAMVLVTAQRNFLPKDAKVTNIYDIEDDLARCILKSLKEIGLESLPINFSNSNISFCDGILRRLSGDNTLYPNGELADYYGIIRLGILNNIPSIIVEHAYLDNESDYRNFLSSDEKLKMLAKADALGIATYYGLKKI